MFILVYIDFSLLNGGVQIFHLFRQFFTLFESNIRFQMPKMQNQAKFVPFAMIPRKNLLIPT